MLMGADGEKWTKNIPNKHEAPVSFRTPAFGRNGCTSIYFENIAQIYAYILRCGCPSTFTFGFLSVSLDALLCSRLRVR